MTDATTTDIKRWFQLATSWPVVRRALSFSVIVGAILIAINHGPNLFSGKVTTTHVFQMILTVLVPYTVSTLSSVSAMLQFERQNRKSELQDHRNDSEHPA